MLMSLNDDNGDDVSDGDVSAPEAATEASKAEGNRPPPLTVGKGAFRRKAKSVRQSTPPKQGARFRPNASGGCASWHPIILG